MNKLIVFGLVLSAVVCLAQNEDSWYGKAEASCLKEGGLCIAQSECERPMGQEGELCPKQAAQGYQCCFGLPKNERRCGMRGGECLKKGVCSQDVVFSEASDCGAEEECCIRV